MRDTQMSNDSRLGSESQSLAFKAAAVQLGCDESEAAFDAALSKVATAPVEKSEPTAETVAKPTRKRAPKI